MRPWAGNRLCLVQPGHLVNVRAFFNVFGSGPGCAGAVGTIVMTGDGVVGQVVQSGVSTHMCGGNAGAAAQLGAKLWVRLPATSRQPSTMTKKISLNGNATLLGGSIIMPMDIRTLETTRSMIMNGK